MSLVKDLIVVMNVLPPFLLSALSLFLLDCLCVRRRLLKRLQEKASPEDPPLDISDASRTFTVPALRAVWRSHVLERGRAARLHGVAPSPRVVRLDVCPEDRARDDKHLLDYVRPGRPLVVTLGSGS